MMKDVCTDYLTDSRIDHDIWSIMVIVILEYASAWIYVQKGSIYIQKCEKMWKKSEY